MIKNHTGGESAAKVSRAQASLRVLMISLDPGLLSTKAGTGDTLERHKAYASFVDSLDIIVLGGSSPETVSYEKLTIHSTGAKGFFGLLKGLRMARTLARERGCGLIVTQDPHATGWIGMRLKKERGIPLLVDIHGDFWKNKEWIRESWKNYVFAAIQQKVVVSADRLRVVSFGVQSTLLAAGIPQNKIEVINTPINSKVFQDMDEHQRIFSEELRFKYRGKKIIIFCGRLVAAKNLPFLIDVVAQLKKRRDDWVLLLIGIGDEQAAIEAKVRALHLASNVQLLGMKAPQELVPYYRAATLMVLPSTNESFGKVIIEAGIAGIPCLATETTGATHIIVDGKTGFLVPRNDPDAFLEVLDEMLEYPEQTKQLGEWAHELYLEKYAQQPTIDRILALWKLTARL